MSIVWYSGDQNYKKHAFTIDHETKKHQYNLELTDVDFPNDRTVYQIFNDHLSSRQTKTVEVLYSGGLDSEIVLHTCLVNKIPVRAITMRIILNGQVVNTTDMYYSEKFCRENGVQQKIVDLDCRRFYDNGHYFSYLEKYLITHSHVATHFWLFEQCTGFPVIGGDYSWPWTHSADRKLSPMRHDYSQYDRFLTDRGINGIGAMLSHSLESNLLFMKTHIHVMLNENSYGDKYFNTPFFKSHVYKKLGSMNFEPRPRSYGWESVPTDVFDVHKYRLELQSKLGTTDSSITWNDKIGEVLGVPPNTNDRFK